MSDQQKLIKLHISKLKNLLDFDISFDSKRVVGIFGPNGCGKSTLIHVLSSIYKPKTNKGRNTKFSDFFKSDENINWRGSKFTMHYYERNGRMGGVDNYTFEKKKDRWMWHYESRPERDVVFIGVDSSVPDIENETNKAPTIKTRRDPAAIRRWQLIRDDISYVMGVNYTDVYNSIGRKSYLSLEKSDGIKYKSLCMGAGEQRILRILRTLHNVDDYTLVLIDELDLTLHKAALMRLLDKIVHIAEDKKLQVIFTSHREELTERLDIDIRHIYQTSTKTICLNNTTPECIDRMTGDVTRPLDIYVEDDMAKTIVIEYLEQVGKMRRVNVQKFGAIENVFSVGAGLFLSGKLTDNVLLLTDGDRYRTADEKIKQIHKHYSGTEVNYDANCNTILSHIQQFCVNQDGLSPEKYVWETLSNSTRQNEIITAAKQIIYVDDKHKYVEDIINTLGLSKENGMGKIIAEFCKEKVSWDSYILHLADWIQRKINEEII